MKPGACVGRGKTADVFEWGAHEVIKVFHGPAGAEQEAKNARTVHALGVRVPRVSGLVEYEGRSCIVYEKVDGRSLLAHIDSTPASLSHAAGILADVQAELHQVRVDAPSNLRTELTGKITNAQALSERQKQQSSAILSKLPDGFALCHYDLHPDNILLASDGPVIIDWMNVLVGDPLADVARTSMMLKSTAVPPEAPAWLRDRSARLFFHEQYLGRYARISGIDRSEAERWLPPILAARADELRGREQAEILRLLDERLMDE